MILLITILAMIGYQRIHSKEISQLVMGAQLFQQSQEPGEDKVKKAVSDLESYIRPSKLPILNTRIYSQMFNMQGDGNQPSPPEKVKIPTEYFSSPEETVLNYFSILRDAENLTADKIGGCGTVGASRYPFPLAYNFFTPEYQSKVPYEQYMKSFEGIGHTSLIRMQKLPPDQLHPQDLRYFVELETIEGSDKGVTYFAYYYGPLYIQKQGEKYLISDVQLTGEDFLCAPMHGWAYDAEANVSTRYGYWCNMVQTLYPAQEEGFMKNIYFKGTDGFDYWIQFMHLTNGTDVEVAQYRKDKTGKWETVYLHPEDCVKDKKR